MLTKNDNLAIAAEELRKLGPKYVVIKKGADGSMLVGENEFFMLPGFPTKEVKDPTGAGDAFAGAFMGYLASVGKTDAKFMRTAIAYGTVTASLVIEGFSMSSIATVGKTVIDARLALLRKMTEF